MPNDHSTRILIADDDHDAADSLAELLRLAGYAVAVAYNGGDALRQAIEFFPEAIVLDLNMPVLTGFVGAARYRTAAGRTRPPLIALTGERLEGEVSREELGTESREGHPTVLYEVTTKQGDRTEVYYQWVATDLRFPLKLARKDGSWIVEYQHLKIRPMADYLFQLPVNFLPLEEFDGPAGMRQPRDPQADDSKPAM